MYYLSLFLKWAGKPRNSSVVPIIPNKYYFEHYQSINNLIIRTKCLLIIGRSNFQVIYRVIVQIELTLLVAFGGTRVGVAGSVLDLVE
jgi:hypothetical protein